MVMCQTRVESSLIRPGVVGIDGKVASVLLNEERIRTLKTVGLCKAKGKTHKLKREVIFIFWFQKSNHS